MWRGVVFCCVCVCVCVAVTQFTQLSLVPLKSRHTFGIFDCWCSILCFAPVCLSGLHFASRTPRSSACRIRTCESAEDAWFVALTRRRSALSAVLRCVVSVVWPRASKHCVQLMSDCRAARVGGCLQVRSSCAQCTPTASLPSIYASPFPSLVCGLESVRHGRVRFMCCDS